MGHKHFVGLDLGQAQEFTALAVLEWSLASDSGTPIQKVSHYAVRHLERLPPGTPFTGIGVRLGRLFAAPQLANGMLVVDLTAGRPVLDMLRRLRLQARIRPMTLTAGHKASWDDGGEWLVPKKELVSTLQVLLQSRRLRVAPALAEAQVLVRELSNFQMRRAPLASESLDAWREGPHDDLVLAVAIAAWEGERHPPVQPSPPRVLSRGLNFGYR
jgi:hypothetical protein